MIIDFVEPLMRAVVDRRRQLGHGGGPAAGPAAGTRTTLACRDPEQAEPISRHHRNPRYLYDIELPPDAGRVGARRDVDLAGAELVAFAVPSRGVRATVAAVCRPAPAAMRRCSR